jgi:hypothetical protein
MAEFHIKGHIKHAAPLRFIAIESMRAMAVLLGDKLRREGHEVLAVRLAET